MDSPSMTVGVPMRHSKQWKIALAMALSFFCGCAMTASYQQGGVSAVALYASNTAIALPAAAAGASPASMLISLAIMGLALYLVHTWHGEIKAKGKTPTIGMKSIACIICCCPGGCLAIFEPIDEAV